jgi:phosphoketolase
MAASKRKQWLSQNMEEACKSVEKGMGLLEAARAYNVPVETLRRRV